nr:PucR family transcriptional regulator [Pseudoclavibacter sp. Marseille-Q3772]
MSSERVTKKTTSRTTRRVTVASPEATVTIGELLAMPELESRGIDATEKSLSLGITAVQVLDLTDVSAHLLGGELLLTTGLGFQDSDDWFEQYVKSLVAAGVRAIGFGIEPVYTRVPTGLIKACERNQLPLIAFPEPVAFIDVISAFHRALAARRHESLETLNAVTFDLLKAAVSRSPASHIANSLARRLNLVAVIELGDEVLHTGSTGPYTSAELIPEVTAQPITESSNRTIDKSRRYRILEGQLDVLSTTLRSPKARVPIPGRITIVTDASIGSTELTAELRAAALLELIYTDTGAASTKIDALLMSLLLSSLARPDRHERQHAAQELRKALESNHGFSVAVCRPNDGSTIRGHDLAWWRASLGTPLVDINQGCLRAVLARRPSQTQLNALSGSGWDITVETVDHPDDIPFAMEQAQALVAQHNDVGVWHGLAPTPVQRAASQSLLGQLGDPDDSKTTELSDTLHAWLQQHGNWDATARQLGVHRNVVRRRIDLASARLGLSLDSARIRAELVLALDSLQTN